MAFIEEARQTLGSIDLAAGGSRGLERVQRGWSWLQRQRFGRDIPNLDVVLKMGASRIAGLVTEGAGLLARSIAVRGRQRHHHAVRAVLLLPRRRCHHEPAAPRPAVRSVVPRRADPRNRRAHQSEHQLGHHRGARAGRGRAASRSRCSGSAPRCSGASSWRFSRCCRLAHGLCGCPSRCGCC